MWITCAHTRNSTAVLYSKFDGHIWTVYKLNVTLFLEYKSCNVYTYFHFCWNCDEWIKWIRTFALLFLLMKRLLTTFIIIVWVNKFFRVRAIRSVRIVICVDDVVNQVIQLRVCFSLKSVRLFLVVRYNNLCVSFVILSSICTDR